MFRMIYLLTLGQLFPVAFPIIRKSNGFVCRIYIPDLLFYCTEFVSTNKTGE